MAAAATEREAGSRANQEYDVTSRCNLGLVFLLIELQINKIETSYITIHKVYYFGGPVRSQSPHGPNDTSWDIALVLMEEFFLKGSHPPSLVVRSGPSVLYLHQIFLQLADYVIICHQSILQPEII